MNAGAEIRRPTSRSTKRASAVVAMASLWAAAGAASAQDGAESAAVAAPPAEPAPEPDPWTEKVWAAVYAAKKDEPESAVASRIGALGARAIPAVFAVYQSLDGDFRSPVKRTTLLASFREFAAADVVAFLATKLDEKTPHDTLIEVLQVAGAAAGRNCTKVALAAAVRLPPLVLRKPAFTAQVRTTLASTLRVDPEGWPSLREAWPALDPTLRNVALDAVEATRGTDGLRFLAGLLGQDPAVNFDVLRHMCRMPRLAPRPLSEDAVQKVRWLTKDQSPPVRSAAILFLGLVHDANAFGLALSMLEDSSSDVIEVALVTLRRTSGAALPADAEAWREWRAADDAWREHDMEREIDLLGSKDAAIVAETLKSLGARRRHAKDVVNPIATFLTAPDAKLRRAACEALAALEDAGAPQSLVGALADEDPEVAKAAGAALVAVTGLRLPGDPVAWRAALR